MLVTRQSELKLAGRMTRRRVALTLLNLLVRCLIYYRATISFRIFVSYCSMEVVPVYKWTPMSTLSCCAVSHTYDTYQQLVCTFFACIEQTTAFRHNRAFEHPRYQVSRTGITAGYRFMHVLNVSDAPVAPCSSRRFHTHPLRAPRYFIRVLQIHLGKRKASKIIGLMAALLIEMMQLIPLSRVVRDGNRGGLGPGSREGAHGAGPMLADVGPYRGGDCRELDSLTVFL